MDIVGVFDSGLGGLTAVKELADCMPGEDIVYFGDTGRVPYGTRSKETIIKYVRQDIRFLLTFPIKAILVACGTASSLALPEAVADVAIPVFGVVEPACKTASRVTKNKRIGIIGTPATISSGSYEKILSGLDPAIETKSVACPLFVPLVENGRYKRGDPLIEIAAREYLEPFGEFGPDVLILGCTHYPLLKDVICDIMGEGVVLIDPGYEAARYVRGAVGYKEPAGNTTGKLSFYVSDNTYKFSTIAESFLMRSVDSQIKLVDIEKY